VAEPPKKENRKAPADEPLSAEVVLWLNELPETVRPMQTCARFPRIVNNIAKAWPQAQQCRALFDDLLLDNRGDRQGFPMDIAFELAALKNYYETAVNRFQQTAWDDIIRRSRER